MLVDPVLEPVTENSLSAYFRDRLSASAQRLNPPPHEDTCWYLGSMLERFARSDSLFLAKLPSVKILPGDRLFVKDTPENLKHYEGLLGATLFSATDTEHPVDEERPLTAEGQQLAEVVITRGSPLHLRTLTAARFSASASSRRSGGVPTKPKSATARPVAPSRASAVMRQPAS